MKIPLRRVAAMLGIEIELGRDGDGLEHRFADDAAGRFVFCAARAES